MDTFLSQLSQSHNVSKSILKSLLDHIVPYASTSEANLTATTNDVSACAPTQPPSKPPVCPPPPTFPPITHHDLMLELEHMKMVVKSEYVTAQGWAFAILVLLIFVMVVLAIYATQNARCHTSTNSWSLLRPKYADWRSVRTFCNENNSVEMTQHASQNAETKLAAQAV